MATVETGAGLARDRLAAVSPAKTSRRVMDMLLLLRWFRLSNCTPGAGRAAWVRFCDSLGHVWRDGVAHFCRPAWFLGSLQTLSRILLSKIAARFPSSCPHDTHVMPEIVVASGQNSREAIHGFGFILSRLGVT